MNEKEQIAVRQSRLIWLYIENHAYELWEKMLDHYGGERNTLYIKRLACQQVEYEPWTGGNEAIGYCPLCERWFGECGDCTGCPLAIVTHSCESWDGHLYDLFQCATSPDEIIEAATEILEALRDA